jgi:hypothetical protein
LEPVWCRPLMIKRGSSVSKSHPSLERDGRHFRGEGADDPG